MARKKREPWLDWDNSLAEVAIIKERRRKKRALKPKYSYFWAFFWLLGFGVLGVHRMYLGQFVKGIIIAVLWAFFGLFSLAADSNLSDSGLNKLDIIYGTFLCLFLLHEAFFILGRTFDLNEETNK